MSQVRLSVLSLAAPLLLALAIPGDELEFHPKSGAEVKKELKLAIELKPEKIEFTVNGESMPPENLGGLGDTTMKVKLAVDVTDKYVQSKEGRPTDLLRTFDSLALSYEAGEEKGDAPKFDQLEGKTVRFKWNGDSDAYGYTHSYSKLDCQAHSHAKSSADARTAPVKASKLIADS